MHTQTHSCIHIEDVFANEKIANIVQNRSSLSMLIFYNVPFGLSFYMKRGTNCILNKIYSIYK